MSEMTEQLIFPVLWSTQYNPKSVILFNNETINFQISDLITLLRVNHSKVATCVALWGKKSTCQNF